MTCIDTASEENARFATIEIRCAKEIFRGTMTVTVTPGSIQVGLTVLKTLQGIIHRDIRHTCGAIHVDQVFGTFVHKPVGTATCGCTVVLRSITDDVSLAISSMNRSTVSGTHDGLRLSVKVPVVGHNVLLIVLKVAHIRTAVHPPEYGAIKLQTLKDGVFAVMSVTRETGVDLTLVVIFQEYLHLTVAIDIRTAGIIGYEDGGNRFIVLGSYLQITIGPRGSSGTLGLFHTMLHGLNRIAAGRIASSIGIVGGCQVLCYERTITIKVICDIIVFITLDAPADEDTTGGLHRHHTAIQFVNDSLCISI